MEALVQLGEWCTTADAQPPLHVAYNVQEGAAARARALENAFVCGPRGIHPLQATAPAVALACLVPGLCGPRSDGMACRSVWMPLPKSSTRALYLSAARVCLSAAGSCGPTAWALVDEGCTVAMPAVASMGVRVETNPVRGTLLLARGPKAPEEDEEGDPTTAPKRHCALCRLFRTCGEWTAVGALLSQSIDSLWPTLQPCCRELLGDWCRKRGKVVGVADDDADEDASADASAKDDRDAVRVVRQFIIARTGEPPFSRTTSLTIVPSSACTK